MKTRFIFGLLTLIIASCAAQSLDAFKDVTVQSVDRQIDARTQLYKIVTTVEIKNERDTPLNEIYFAIPSEYSHTLRLFLIRDNFNASKLYDYKIVENLKIKSDYNATLYKVELESPLKPGQSKSFKLSETYYGRMSPLPRYINVFEDQKLVLEENSYFFSPYPVLSQVSVFKLAASPITYSDPDARLTGSQLEYKFPSTVGAFQRRHNRIHFENNTPHIVFKEVTKVIEVSHWGNIYIEESYKLANEGAEFRGEFSRVDFNPQNRNSGKSALRALSAKYPVHAWGMHYRDEVGNISTSRAIRDPYNVQISIVPRFAVFGGWSHNWVLSYNLPTQQYLSVKEDNANSFILKQNFGFPFENVLAEKYTLKIILPEGVKNPKIDLPFSVDNQRQEKTFSYLDIEGRTTLILEKENVLDYHDKNLFVTYDFNSENLLTEPGLLFAFFLGVFAVLIIIGRIDFAFRNRSSKVKSE